VQQPEQVGRITYNGRSASKRSRSVLVTTVEVDKKLSYRWKTARHIVQQAMAWLTPKTYIYPQVLPRRIRSFSVEDCMYTNRGEPQNSRTLGLRSRLDGRRGWLQEACWWGYTWHRKKFDDYHQPFG